MKNFKTPNGFVIKQEDVDGILANCFEGCSNYWINGIVTPVFPKGAEFGSDVLSRGANIEIEFDDETKTLTLDMFLKGVDLFRSKYTGYDDSDSLACDADSDNILQFALFGELIYG